MASALISHAGLPMSEPMALGLASAVLFAHIPFIKVGGQPLTAYRSLPGHVLKGLERTVGVRFARQRFKDPQEAEEALDQALASGVPVGLQTGVFWLPYFPPEMRFHFNAHNLVIIGRTPEGVYRVSDPVFEELQVCDPQSLQRARFAEGAFAPKGLMYQVESVPASLNYPRLIPIAIHRAVRVNHAVPVPFVGAWAIRRLAARIGSLDRHLRDRRSQALFIGHIIRMQEEIGTGGGGFRFMYASFLQESARILQDEHLDELAALMVDSGDRWRSFAAVGVDFCRGEGSTGLTEVSRALRACGEAEATAWGGLRGWLRGQRAGR